MNNRMAIVLMCGLIGWEANLCAGPTMSKISNKVLDKLDALDDKEKMMIVASSMVVTAIGSILYQSSMIESAANNHNHCELHKDQAESESLATQEDDLADLDFQRSSELSDDSMPGLERVCDDGTVVDAALAEQAISDVIAWSQQSIIKPAVSTRSIPPVRGLGTSDVKSIEKK